MARLKYRSWREFLFVTLLMPSLLGLLLFFIVPFIVSLRMAVIDDPVMQNFVGFDHFTATFGNSAFRLGIRNTFIFMSMSVPINMMFALLVAMMLRRLNGIWKGMLGAIFVLPLVLPSGSVVHVWRSLFGLNGFINRLFFGEPINWLSTEWSIFLVVLIFLWKNVGFNIVLYLAGLNLIPREYYENAQIEGAGDVRQFLSVTLVYLMPTTFMVFLLSIIQSFQSFREIFLLTGAYPHRSLYMLQHYMNNQFAALNYQRLASASYILTLGIIVLVIVMLFVQSRVTHYE